ncbi:hypothetical protein CRUP_004656, partial [Coryphaenoides rupestris]
MCEQVASMCEQLIKAVNVMMEPGTSQIYRLEALKFCEEFKETCAFCVPCGLQLAEKTQTSVGTLSILEEENHIKDALSRITVEMIKREWPQNWPDMLKEMEALTSLGESQTELVMLILLRLAEDVVTFQTLPTQRRRDIQQTLTQNMDSIFSFILAILQINRVLLYEGLPHPQPPAHAPQQNLLSGKLEDRKPLMLLFDDVAMNYIFSAAHTLLHLAPPCFTLQHPATPCFTLHHLAPLCSTLHHLAPPYTTLLHLTPPCNTLHHPAPPCTTLHHPASPYTTLHHPAPPCTTLHNTVQVEKVGVVERHYVFLKRLCQVLCALGTQVTSLVVMPANLNKYMEAMLSFTTHHSQ